MPIEKFPSPAADNIVSLESRVKAKDGDRDNERPSLEVKSAPGTKDDPRMQEAVRLMEAFLAIEEPTARDALVTLAEQLVSYDWARRGQRR